MPCLSDWLLYLLSECSLASPGSPCTNLEADDCKNEYSLGDHCCCGQCTGWLSLACVLDSTTGAQHWLPKGSLCPADGCGNEGEWCKENGFIFLFLKYSLPQVLSNHQTTLTTTPTIWRRPRRYKWRRDWSSHYNSLHLTFMVATTWQSRTATGQPWWRRAAATPCRLT